MREGENDMKMLDGQQVPRHFIHPQFFFDILALRTMTIAATVPTIDFSLASLTGNFMPSQSLCFAIPNMLQHRAHTVIRFVLFYEGCSELSDDSADGKRG